ncbi:MAG: hypothetical protein HYW34_02945 [Candidatus Brennerbacteria bacterium]|nr:hypothetical protein [Candidatus Brennerbacteria bacterium]
MKEKNLTELELKKQINIIGEAVQMAVERCEKETSQFDLEIHHDSDFINVNFDKNNPACFYFKIYKVEKKKVFWGIWINKEKLTPICFIKDAIKKSPYGEYWLEIELYDEIQLLPIIRAEMEQAAAKLGAKTKVIVIYRDKNDMVVFNEYA